MERREERVRKETVRESVGVKPMMNKVDAARLRWWGHLERMQEERVASRRWRWRPEGVRPRGRPRKRWRDTVEDSLRRHQMPAMDELMADGIVMDPIEQDGSGGWPH